MATSDKKDFLTGSSFHRVLWDDAQQGNSGLKLLPDSKIKKVVICSGKVYFDILHERDTRNLSDIYLLRIEQFYPFPERSLTKELTRFNNAEICWCQEEPKNQGAWSFIEPNLELVLNKIKTKAKRPAYAGRAASASPATGFATQHKKQQTNLIDEALNILGETDD